ncbi:MAG: hypothetical protein ACLP9L_18475 [Thermoguttaceae bacterium]
MNILAQLVAWLNLAANALGRLLLAPIALLPGWLSITFISALLGLACVTVFKYTSNQRAMQRVRNDIQAQFLVLRLFPDSLRVTLRAEGRLLRGAVSLLGLSAMPMLVMIVPVSLLLAQLGLWYQTRPLRIGEEAVITLQLRGEAGTTLPDVQIQPTPAVETVLGPVQVLSKREICWDLRARENGYHRLKFHFDGETVDKELVIGDGFMRTSAQRPEWCWSDILWQPAEAPFPPGSTVRAIRIDYLDRESWISGSDWWLVYCFGASMFFAFCFRPWLKVTF